MPNRFSLRFESPLGGVLLSLNGFSIFGPDDSGRAVAQISQFLRPGRNSFELVSQLPGMQAAFAIADISGGDPELAPIVLEGRLSGGAERVEEYLTIEDEVPAFGWHDARIVDNLPAQQRAVYEIAENLATLLEHGPDDRLLDVLRMKHSEIALSVGMPKSEMDAGLTEGLAHLRQSSGFRVDLAGFDDFMPVLSSDGRIVTLRRRSGGDAIRIIDGIADPGFGVTVAIIRDRWQIVR